MPKPRVLWLSNKLISPEDGGSTGTWLHATARALRASGEVELGIIAQGVVPAFTRRDWGTVTQWVVPATAAPSRTGLPAERHVRAIAAAADSFAPDVIHVWGTENYWGLLTARKRVPYPAVLETQGLKSAIAPVYAGGLGLSDQLRCVGIKELLRRSFIWRKATEFERWGRLEAEMIRGHRFVTVQSDWLEARVRAIHRAAVILRNDFLLRQPFYGTEAWRPPNGGRIFCSAAYPSPFKGLHTAVDALAILKKGRPELELRVAGAVQRSGLRQDGYVAWLTRRIERLGLRGAIRWLGPLGAADIVSELQAADAVMLPTFVEGYCLALAEAMAVGTPAVVAFVGGTGSLARDGESALFFPPGDAAMCAYQLERVLADEDFALRLSRESRRIAAVRNDRQNIIQRQLSTYRAIMEAR